MRRFPQSAIWQARLDAGYLDNEESNALPLYWPRYMPMQHASNARESVGMVRRYRPAPGKSWPITALLDQPRRHALLAEIAAWVSLQERRLARIFAPRKTRRDGYVNAMGIFILAIF